MKRRAALAGAGVGLSAAVTGCLSQPPDALAPWANDEQGSVGAIHGYPAYDDILVRGDREIERVVDYDQVDHEDTPTFVERSTETTTADGAIELSLINRRAEDLLTGPFAWELFKWTNGRWHPIVGLTDVLLPGATATRDDPVTWVMHIVASRDHLSAGEMALTAPDEGDALAWTLDGLGGGRYAFGARGRYEETMDDARLVFHTELTIDADPIELTPTNQVESVEQDGDLVIVDADRGIDGPRCAYTIERVPETEADAPTPLIDERLVQDPNSLLYYRARRDAFAHYKEYDPDVVRVIERNDRNTPFRIDEARYYAYEGSYFRESAERLNS